MNDTGEGRGEDGAAGAELPVPHDLQIELHDDPAAEAAFASLPPSHRNEYIDWIISAKRPETRLHRVEQTAIRVKRGPREGFVIDF